MARNRNRSNWLVAATVLAAGGLLAIGGSHAANASAGCDAVNAGGFNKSEKIGLLIATIADFAAGDAITFNIAVDTHTGSAKWSLGSGEDKANLFDIDYEAATETTQSYTVTGSDVAPGGVDTTLTQGLGINMFRAAITVTATCTAG